MQETVICAALLADGIASTSRSDQAVLVRGGRIAAVGDAATVRQEAGEEAELIDLGNACLGPGLIDNHTHLSLAGDSRPYVEQFSDSDEMMVLIGAMNLQRHLRAGITLLCEHGARNKVGFALKEGWERGYIGGSRMLVSGRPITCTGGHFHMCNEVADGEEEVRRSVRRLVHEGADYIKVMASGGGTAGTIPKRASYSVAELHAIVHEAHHLGRWTAAHCRAKESMIRAVEAGIDLMEHAEFLDFDGQLRFDPAVADMMVESGIWVSPTLQAWTSYPRIVELRQLRDAGQATEADERKLAAMEKRTEGRLDIVRRMIDHGLKERLVPGTDSGVGNLAFGHLDYDLQLFEQCGFTPAEVFASATRISAQACGMEDELGTIEVGKIADLAAFDGDPNVEVEACSRVVAVFQEGQRVV